VNSKLGWALYIATKPVNFITTNNQSPVRPDRQQSLSRAGLGLLRPAVYLTHHSETLDRKGAAGHGTAPIHSRS